MSVWTLEANTNSLFGLAVATVVIFLYVRRGAALTSKNGIPLPPGPPARSLWDSDLPTVNAASIFTDLVAEYGPVVTLRQGAQVTIIIGRVDAANEIMEKEGAALVDRPRMVAAGEMQAGGMRFVFLRSGDLFRRFRKVTHTHLQPKATVAYQDVQMESARNVITDLMNDPKNHQEHAKRFAASVILRITYGRSTPTSNDDPDVKRIHQASINFLIGAHPGAFLVNRYPWLKHVPGYGRRLKEFHKLDLELFRDLLGRVEVEKEMNLGGGSFVKALLENVAEHGLSRDEMAYLAGELYGAASDTTAIAITNMIMAAACHPHEQDRVRKELDAIVGEDRMPSWEDAELLPQLRAFILEALRWRPVLPIGIMHRSTRDIIWRGQWIPEGANVIGCHWAISRDPMAFPEPDKFDPQRWFDNNGHIRSDISAYAFGFGRRACPGQYLANKSLYISLALLLWSFRIVQRPDAPIDPNAFTDTLVSRALPFEVEFVPRMEEDKLREMMSEPVI